MLTYIIYLVNAFLGGCSFDFWAQPAMGLICIICGGDTIKHVSSNVQLINSADVSYQLNCWFQTKIAKENIRNTDSVWFLLEFKFVHRFVFAGRDWNPEAAAWGQSDVHQNRGEAEDGQDGRWLGSEMERCTAVKERKTGSPSPLMSFLIRLCHLTALFTITLIIPTSRRLPKTLMYIDENE